jgi:chromosome segregation ATPase
VKLKSKVSKLLYDCVEESFKFLEKDFIESRTEVQTLCEERNKPKESLENKTSEFEALNVEKDKHIAMLEAKLRQAKEESEAKTTKIRQALAKVVVDLNVAQVKMVDLAEEMNHVRQLNENYRILMKNCYTLGNRCCNELEKTFSSVGAKSRAKTICRW